MASNKISSELGSANDSTSRLTSSNRTNAEPLPATPNVQGNQNKSKKQHVALTGRAHTRNFSNRGTLNKIHGDSHIEAGGNRKPQRNASSTSLIRKNIVQHANLKRNRSSAEIKPKFALGFDFGDHEDGWEETSSSTSPAVSRSNSRPTSKSQSPMTIFQALPSPPPISELHNELPTSKKSAHPSGSTQPKGITERLLSRTPCLHTTQTSLAVATPVVNSHSSPSSPNRSAPLNNRKVSLFTSNSNSNAGLSQFLFSHYASSKKLEDVKRAQSMKDLSNFLPDDEESSLLYSYQLGTDQSRTQQKQWLQRASSIIEPKQLETQYGSEVGLFVGSTYEGPTLRVKNMLARTGTEYLVVRRYHDPVDDALKRIVQIPGMNLNRRIPSKPKKSIDATVSSSGSRYGLSQSLRSYATVRNSPSSVSISRGSKDLSGPCHDINEGDQTYLDARNGPSNTESEEIMLLLRKLWDKSPELSVRS
ncbi:hypothetical protein OnM2_017038 [Erysiphe neolycopersici]|uniref:Uncharacterized protein n=1 Tax=Erysiphe neolycopersici TaxID=212602 RepID=A0A420I4I6_9PEZI|nr:hypothetical protein OnM2_017038 [Erysiphe neolycopersici]